MYATPTLPYSRERRQTILNEYLEHKHHLLDIRSSIEMEGESNTRLEMEDVITAHLLSTRDRYRIETPIVPVSRCPFTGIELHLSIDTLGLDGLWWDVEDPVRMPQNFPPTVFALNGAIHLASSIEFTSHLVRPGPGAPYVIPRLLAEPDTTAVLASVAIGDHQGYVITYFGYPPQAERPVVDEWGQFGWDIQRGQSPGWDSHPLLIEDCDFDLEPWLEQNRLLWIDPGDETLTLRAGMKGCPYRDLKGRKTLQTLFEGRLT